MADAKIKLIKGGTTYTYVIKGLLRLSSRKSQQTPAFPIPQRTDQNAVLTTISGQERRFTGDFILIERTDDYTDGTGSPGASPYSIKDQREYLNDTIFQASGRHILVDTDGTEYIGRIQDLEFTGQGDDPLSDSVVFTFTRGVVFG